MAQRFYELLFTPAVRALQERFGSRDAYRRYEAPDAPPRDRLTERETAFIAARDSFYLASVSAAGWPYLQHRGGPAGFLRALDERTLGFADFRGNRQYLSAGNLAGDDRVALFLMDYPNRRRLKILGRARIVEPDDDPALMGRLEIGGYRARVERGILIRIEAFDWNCSQHITPRYSEAELRPVFEELQLRIARLEQENARLAAAEPRSR
ncbi:MAG TPA: pyridoxamine 5'-phosphate oxidase family protein [Pseudomonadales bacterium]